METTTSVLDVKNTVLIPIETTKIVAKRTSIILELIGGAKVWFGKERLTPKELKEKYNRSHRDNVTDEEMQVILRALAIHLVLTSNPCPGGVITEVKFQD